MRLLITVGTRPEAVKLAPLIHALRSRPESGIELKVCATAQHRELLDQVLELFEIEPDLDLGSMRPGQSLAALHARMLQALDEVMESEKPDRVIVQGDTTTALAAAEAAFYRKIPVGHVEAGLRSHDPQSPFPEEANRRTISLLADLHFAPTAQSCRHLSADGIPPEQILMTGNTVVDALMQIKPRLDASGTRKSLGIRADRRLVLVTMHRRENQGDGFFEIASALRELAATYRDDVEFALPVHPNPKVADLVKRELEGLANFHLLAPLGYPEFLSLLADSELVLSDSGGVQEEAPSLGVPALVLRESTERPEGIEAGVARLVGTKRSSIIEESTRLLNDPKARAAMVTATNPYGDGRAAERIVRTLIDTPSIERVTT